MKGIFKKLVIRLANYKLASDGKKAFKHLDRITYKPMHTQEQS